jgi:hypothetical protein
MSMLVWIMISIAIWHFAIFFPDRFWGGIVGALLGAVTGAMLSGAAAQLATGDSIGQTDFATVLYAIPGTLLGLAVTYALGVRAERDAVQH